MTDTQIVASIFAAVVAVLSGVTLYFQKRLDGHISARFGQADTGVEQLRTRLVVITQEINDRFSRMDRDLLGKFADLPEKFVLKTDMNRLLDALKESVNRDMDRIQDEVARLGDRVEISKEEE